jgi:hypothetical protein
MTTVSDHLAFVAANLTDDARLAQFAARLSVAVSDDEVVVTLSDRSLSIRATAEGLKLGGDEIALGADPQETLGRVAKRLGQRLTQMDGQGI